MVKQSVCMQCRGWSKGWHDRVNEPYDQFYCTWCWAGFMGYKQLESVRGKDTVWWREQWKAATNAPRHASSPFTCRKYWQKHSRRTVNWDAHFSNLDAQGEEQDEEAEEEESQGPDEIQREDEEEEKEEEEEDDDDEDVDEEENPAWVQRAMEILFKYGGGNMNWATFQSKGGLHGISKQAILSRPEFESCGRKNCSVRLVKAVRLQRYGRRRAP
ncbi:unnamed protein product [Symbiodinium sp. CCMP2456]|nr:unnamed protein product [Symbiodinium sp. CCMP2456]